MKQPADKFTVDMFGAKRRGRPPKLAPKSSAQRQREFRQRHKFDFLIAASRNEKSNSGE